MRKLDFSYKLRAKKKATYHFTAELFLSQYSTADHLMYFNLFTVF